MSRPADQPPPWDVMLRWLDANRWWCFVVLAGLYAAAFNGQWRITADGSVHLMLAQVITGQRAAPLAIDLNQISPGLAWLAVALGGRPGVAAGLVTLALAGVGMGLAFLVFSSCRKRSTAVLLTLLLGLNAMWHGVAFEFLTELPFTVGLLLMLYGHERRIAGQAKTGWLAIVLGVAVMACFRSVVLVVLVAYGLSELITLLRRPERRYVGLGMLAVAALASLALWFVSPAVRADIGHLFGALGGIEGRSLGRKAAYMADEAVFSAVFGQDVSGVVALPVGLLLLVVGLALARVRLLWGLLVAGFVAQWLLFLPVERYVLPLLPLLILGYWELLIGIAGRFVEPFRGWTMGAGLFLLVGPNLVGIGMLIAEQRATPFLERYDHGKYVAVTESAAWLAEHAGDEDVVVADAEVAAELAYLSGAEVMTYVQQEAFDCPNFWVCVPMAEHVSAGLASVHWTLDPPRFKSVDHVTGQPVSIHRVDRGTDGPVAEPGR